MELSDEVKKMGYEDEVLTADSEDDFEVGEACSQCASGCFTCNTCQTGESIKPPSIN